MMLENGMTGITAKKAELLHELKKNRAAHRKLFLDAQKVYRSDVIKELDAMLKDAREGKPIRRAVTLIEPQDHTKDYDRIIRMLEMSTKSVIFVSEQEFSQYVLDDWGWKAQFLAQTSNYSNRR